MSAQTAESASSPGITCAYTFNVTPTPAGRFVATRPSSGRRGAESWGEPFERLGEWWSLADPDTKVVGTMCYSPREGLSLTTAGPWLVPNPADSGQPVAIAGLSESSHWTLGDCFLSKSTWGRGEVFIVGYALAGLWLTPDDLVRLDTTRVTLDVAGPRCPSAREVRESSIDRRFRSPRRSTTD